MKNVLVTGGCGFIGSHFIKRLCREKKYSIINVDKLTYAGNARNVENLPILNILHTDVCDDKIHSILRSHNIDIIVHFAAETHVDRSVRFPKDFLTTDILGLFNLVYNSIKMGRLEKFIHISTDEVYGDKYNNEANELYPLVPNSPYAASKAAADILLQSYIKTYDFPAIIIRPCNNYGPNQFPEKLIPMVITRILDGKPALIHGDGKESREWIYVTDCVDAIYETMLKGKAGEIYNLGSGVRLDNLTIVKSLISIMTKTSEPEKYITYMSNRPGNDKRYAVDSDKLLNLLDKEYATTNLIHGLRTTVEWYKNNRGWWPEVNLEANIYDNENYLR